MYIINRKIESDISYAIIAMAAIGGILLIAVGILKFSYLNPIPPSVKAISKLTPTPEPTAPNATPHTQNTNSYLTYEAALGMYRDRRIQIDNCTSQPYQVTYKNGTKIMLDNRSGDPVEIRINGQVYRMWEYEFRIVTLYSKQVPKNLQVDCIMIDQPAYNIANILLQP